MPRETVACLGAGRMGRGIAVVFAYAGHPVTIVDFKPRGAAAFTTLAAEAMDEVRGTLTSLARCGLFDESNVGTIAARVTVVPEADAGAALSSAFAIFEGIPEVLDVKREALSACRCARRAAADHRLDHVDDPGRRPVGRRRWSGTVPQRALAQSGLSGAAGRAIAGCAHRP